MLLSLVLLSLCIPALATNNKYGPFSKHFQKWLRTGGDQYSYALNAVAEYGETGSFGGKAHSGETVHYEPVIFLHGNSDSALKVDGRPEATGWDRTLEEFLSHGHTLKELYGITYGDRNLSNALTRSLNCKDLLGMRRFVEAVLAYTGAPKVDIIAHSMGVSYARKIILGGPVNIGDQTCDLGSSLGANVDALIGISGANFGMCMCLQLADFPACSDKFGFFPGQKGSCDVNDCASAENLECSGKNYGGFLEMVNEQSDEALKQPSFVVSMWSTSDEVLGSNRVWGRMTSAIPDSHVLKIFTNLTHGDTKVMTAKDQYYLATQHPLSAPPSRTSDI